jgi:hypothetical protein
MILMEMDKRMIQGEWGAVGTYLSTFSMSL